MRVKAIVGRWFHTFKDGEIQYQGQVLQERPNEILVQLYSFATGEDNGSPRWVPTDEVATWRLYATSAEMRAAYDDVTPELRRPS